jgi:hypothetical protein
LASKQRQHAALQMLRNGSGSALQASSQIIAGRTPDELAPLAPRDAARRVRVGNNSGRTMAVRGIRMAIPPSDGLRSAGLAAKGHPAMELETIAHTFVP